MKCQAQRVDLADNWMFAQPNDAASKARQLPISQSLLVPSTRSTSPLLRPASPPVQRMVPTLSSRSCPGCRMWSNDFCDRHLRRWKFQDLLTSNQGCYGVFNVFLHLFRILSNTFCVARLHTQPALSVATPSAPRSPLGLKPQT